MFTHLKEVLCKSLCWDSKNRNLPWKELCMTHHFGFFFRLNRDQQHEEYYCFLFSFLDKQLVLGYCLYRLVSLLPWYLSFNLVSSTNNGRKHWTWTPAQCVSTCNYNFMSFLYSNTAQISTCKFTGVEQYCTSPYVSNCLPNDFFPVPPNP